MIELSTLTGTPAVDGADAVAPDAREPSGRTRASIALPALLVVFALAAGGCVFWTSRVTEWTVMTDELQYAKLALAIAEDWSLVPRLHGQYYPSHYPLYPLLIAPLVGLLDMPDAFRAVHIWNALLMASACFPAYLLAVEVVRSRMAALIAAACSVAVPWMSLSALIMTEVAAYPAFLWAVLAIQRALSHPSVGRDALALVAGVVAALARTQFVFLLVAFTLAVAVHELGWAMIDRRGASALRALVAGARRCLTKHPLLLAVSGAALLALALPGPRGLLAVALGNYGDTVGGGLFPPELPDAMVRHMNVVAVGVGVLPFVLTLAFVLAASIAAETKDRHAFAVLLVICVSMLTLITGSFVLRYTAPGEVVDRYLFYIAPLLFVGMVAGLTGRRRPVLLVLVAGAVFAALASFTPFTAPTTLAVPSSPASTAHFVLDGRAYELGALFGIADLQPRPLIIAAGLLLSVALALANRRLAGRVPLIAVGLVVLVFCAAETGYAFQGMLRSQIGAPEGFVLRLEQRDWIDRAVPAGTSVALIASPAFDLFTSYRIWWEPEFWNKSVDRSYVYEGVGNYTPFGTNGELESDPRTGHIAHVEHAPVGAAATQFMLVGPNETRFRPAGNKLAQAPGGVKLLRVELPLRAEWLTIGLSPDGWITEGEPVGVRLFPDAAGRARATRLTFGFDMPAYPARRPRYAVEGAGARRVGVLGALENEQASIDVCVPAGRSIDLLVRGRGQVSLPDDRRMPAVHLRSIDSGPSPKRCRS